MESDCYNMVTIFMPQDHRLQQQRFELKYLVEASLIGGIRDFVSAYLELDEYGVGQSDFAYPVHSVYLDSDDLDTHHQTINGTKNRYKLRLRYYDDQPASPVFFEIKGRVDNCILKRRCGVRRDAVVPLLNGRWPMPEQFVTTEPRHFAALEQFLLRMHSLNASPKLHNSYRREAWVSPHDNSVRVTLDRQVRVEPHADFSAAVSMRDPTLIYAPTMILELKFTDRFPNWFNGLVQRFNLMQSAAAKYSGAVLLLGEAQFRHPKIMALPAAKPARPASIAEILTLAEF